MAWFSLLISFFLANVFGYGGGPASIPLMHREIVIKHQWLNNAEFSNMLALGNSLPGPIATKIAAFTGYDVGGWLGLLTATVGTVVPSAVALIMLLKILNKYKQSPIIKGMTLLVQPVIAVLMLQLVWESATESILTIGVLQFALIAIVAFWLLQRKKVHPAFVIAAAFVYGGFFIA